MDLVTVAEDHAVVTWCSAPVPTEGEVRFGTSPGRLDRAAPGLSGTPYHHAELTGLEPGRTYYYTALSDGVPAEATELAGGAAAAGTPHGNGVHSFTTPPPPPGRHLFTVALVNDLHIGEAVAGLVGGAPSVPGIAQVAGRPPYPEVMAEAMVAEARARGADFLVAAGDLTAEAHPADMVRSREILGSSAVVVRGNHDRPHGGDSFREVYFTPDEPTYFTRDLCGLRLIGLDTYDKPGDGSDDGGMSDAQFAWFAATVLAEPERPTLVAGHHPLRVDGVLAGAGGMVLDRAQAAAVVAAYRRAPGVFLQHAGHTHRNRRTVLFGDVVQQEVAAVKEYPGGYGLLRIHQGGYALNFYKQRADLAREWSERSRHEIDGFLPQITLGDALSDRNSVVSRDFSGLRRPGSG